jgi:two-component system, cell cycle sensor histidine kinase and response regulator CckA
MKAPADQLPGFVWTTDGTLRIDFSLGIPGDAAGRTIEELAGSVPLFDLSRHIRALSGEHAHYETSWAGRDYLVHVQPRFDERGAPSGCAAVALDVTERCASEQAIREREELFRQLVENVHEVFWVSRAETGLVYVSPAFEQIWGRSADEYFDNPMGFFETLHPDDRELFVREWSRDRLRPSTHTFRIVRPDGEVRWIRLRSAPIFDDDGSVIRVGGTAEDITAVVDLEERLGQAARLEAIGQLAGGVAHDFNNVLLVIRGYSSVLQSVLEDSQQRADVEEIAKAADRAASLTRQLLAFGRRQVLQPTLLSVGDVVRDLESLLRRTIRENVELDLLLDDDVPPVVADPAQIEQVLVNLIVNARDSMRDGGSLVVSVRGVELAEAESGISPPPPPGPYVALTVADSGCGIADDALPHIFEPFFTTKDEGIGTGLGLSTVYGIVVQSGGGVGVRTRVDEGTSVTVYLPAGAGEVGNERQARVREPLEAGSETILLVEDEDPVRELVRRVLADAGYRVLPASRPSEAERLLAGESDVDLLLTDVVMPEMSGHELAARIRGSRPEIRTLFISGYVHEVADASQLEGRLLKKPFAPTELTRAVRRVLDGPLPAEAA